MGDSVTNQPQKISPTNDRLLVELLPSTSQFENTLNLQLVDKSKHFRHPSRRGKILAAGPRVRNVRVGETVVFRGDAGYSMDYDPDRIHQLDENTHRWLRESDCLAVEEAVA